MISFFDSTLRDGEQGIGFLMTKKQKIEIFKVINSIDIISTIEVGTPVSSPMDFEVFNEISKLETNKKIAALSRLKLTDINTTLLALNDFNKSEIQLLCVGSYLHMDKKRLLTKKELMNELEASLIFIRKKKCKCEISLIFEDASRGSLELISQQIDLAIIYGVKKITLCDTVGCLTPSQSYSFIKKYCEKYPKIDIGCHFHNDLGMASANTLIAINAEAKELQTTFAGIGERCGNASFEQVLLGLYMEGKITSEIVKEITLKSRQIFEILNKNIYKYSPILGEYAFTTCAGIHQDGIIKYPETYEYINPETVNNKRIFVKNRLSRNTKNRVI